MSCPGLFLRTASFYLGLAAHFKHWIWPSSKSKLAALCFLGIQTVFLQISAKDVSNTFPLTQRHCFNIHYCYVSPSREAFLLGSGRII